MKKWMILMFAGFIALSAAGCAKNQAETAVQEQSGSLTAASVSDSSKEDLGEDIDPEGGNESEKKLVITDVRGKVIEFDQIPQRAVTTAKPFPYIFYSVLGPNDYLVGGNPSTAKIYKESMMKYMFPQWENVDTSWCDKDGVVNMEELLKLKPDVVFCWASSGEEIKKMEAAGLKVVALNTASVDNVKETIRIVSAIYAKEEKGDALISYYEQQIGEVTGKLADIAPEAYPTAIYLYDDMIVSVSRYDHWMVTSCARNPAAGLQGKTAGVDMEQMMLWNPDIIYIGNFTGLQPSDLLENKQEGRDWSMLKAVQNKQVYKVPIGTYRWDPAGVETPLMIKWAAKLQYPERFKDMDMKKEVSDFYLQVYHFTLTDQMLSEILDDVQN